MALGIHSRTFYRAAATSAPRMSFIQNEDILNISGMVIDTVASYSDTLGSQSYHLNLPDHDITSPAKYIGELPRLQALWVFTASIGQRGCVYGK
jgi:hypothetical protein